MKEKITELLKDRLIKRMVLVFILIMSAFLVILFWKWSSLPPQLPLFYSLPRGNEQLGTPFQLLFLPFFSLLIFILNFIVASYLYNYEKLASVLLIITSITVSFLLLVTFLKIVFLIT